MPASTVHRVLVRHSVNRLSWMDRPTGRVIRRYEHDPPGDLVHVDIKKLGRSRRAAGGVPMAVAVPNTVLPREDHGSATRTFTPPSTTTAGSPTARSSMTRRPSPRSGSGVGLAGGSPNTPSTSQLCSPTTAPATDPGCFATNWPCPASSTGAPAPTGHKPTAKLNASTGLSATSGPTYPPTAQKPNAAESLPNGSTPTTITDATPRSAANHP